MNIVEKIDIRLLEMRAPKEGFRDEAQFTEWLKFQEKRSKDKAAFRKKMDDKKFINKLKKIVGLRKWT